MAIDYTDKEAALTGIVTIQEVDGLQEWLTDHPDASISMAGCEHMHMAVLQTLACAGNQVTEWPGDPRFRQWLESLLNREGARR